MIGDLVYVERSGCMEMDQEREATSTTTGGDDWGSWISVNSYGLDGRRTRFVTDEDEDVAEKGGPARRTQSFKDLYLLNAQQSHPTWKTARRHGSLEERKKRLSIERKQEWANKQRKKLQEQRGTRTEQKQMTSNGPEEKQTVKQSKQKKTLIDLLKHYVPRRNMRAQTG